MRASASVACRQQASISAVDSCPKLPHLTQCPAHHPAHPPPPHPAHHTSHCSSSCSLVLLIIILLIMLLMIRLLQEANQALANMTIPDNSTTTPGDNGTAVIVPNITIVGNISSKASPGQVTSDWGTQYGLKGECQAVERYVCCLLSTIHSI